MTNDTDCRRYRLTRITIHIEDHRRHSQPLIGFVNLPELRERLVSAKRELGDGLKQPTDF